MKIETKLITILLIGFSLMCSAQLETYNYKRTLTKTTDEWHKINLPDAVFGRLNNNLNAIRVYGITAKNDTIEAPYLLKINAEKQVSKTIPFNIINKTKGENGYYYTFQLKDDETINHIGLNFKEQNFDWKIDLQASHNQQEWFTLLEDYRILAIKNETTDFEFTKLVIPASKYGFYRLLVKHNKQPNLNSAELLKHEITEGDYKNHKIKKFEALEDKQQRIATFNVELEQHVSISQINIEVKNTFDYYRPVKIEYRNDSIKTEKGWKYYYKTITNKTLNSLEANTFKFNNTIAKHLRITVFNGDNQPLDISNVYVKGNIFELIGRFTEVASYYLAYGNPSVSRPNYDIRKFKTNIPTDLKSLKIGEEQTIEKQLQPKVKPLFENRYWLWLIIGVVILVLGGFTLKMLKKS